MTPEKIEAGSLSYKSGPEVHIMTPPSKTPSGKVSNCQICSMGKGHRMPNLRFQTPGHLRCKECNVNVCGAGCWQVLHGIYSESDPETLPAREPSNPKAKAPATEDDGAQADDEEEEIAEVDAEVVTDSD